MRKVHVRNAISNCPTVCCTKDLSVRQFMAAAAAAAATLILICLVKFMRLRGVTGFGAVAMMLLHCPLRGVREGK